MTIFHSRDASVATKVQLTDKGRYSEVIEVPAASVQTILFTN